MPRMVFLVVCGLLEVMAIFSPRIALSSVDLPTLGRPIIPINPVFKLYILSFSLWAAQRPLCISSRYRYEIRTSRALKPETLRQYFFQGIDA